MLLWPGILIRGLAPLKPKECLKGCAGDFHMPKCPLFLRRAAEGRHGDPKKGETDLDWITR